MKKFALLVLVLFIAACAPICGPAATSQTPTPSASSSATASLTASPTASPSASAAATPTGTPITLPNVATISAPPGDFVWVLVGGTRLFRSGDRGATWEERGIPSGPVGDIAFINALQGWLSSPASPATGCQSQSYAVLRTADGAASWTKVFQSDASDALCKGGVFFADMQRGFLTLSSPNSNPVIARTGDGGQTWSRSSPFPNPPGSGSGSGVLSAGRVRSFNATVFVSALGGGGGNAKTYAFRSTDGGATWTYASTAPQPDVEIAFVTATRWLQIGPPGRSSETTDAGASWHPFTTDYQQAAPVSPQVVFADANIGYASVRGSIQRTADGGVHWTAIKTPGT